MFVGSLPHGNGVAAAFGPSRIFGACCFSHQSPVTFTTFSRRSRLNHVPTGPHSKITFTGGILPKTPPPVRSRGRPRTLPPGTLTLKVRYVSGFASWLRISMYFR